MKNFLIEIALLLLESIRLTRRQRKIEKIGRTKADRERESAKKRKGEREVELLISHFHFLLRFAFTSNDF